MRPEIAEDLLRLPYGQRRTVVVVPDEGFASEPPKAAGGRRRALERLRDRAPMLRGPSSDSRTMHALVELQEDGILLRPVPQSQAGGLGLPVGHPLPGVVYVGNPATHRYYPAADFHRRVFEHKFAEAVRLVMALGATRMTVDWERGWRRELAADLEVPLQKVAKGTGEIRASSDRSSSLLFEARLASGDPELPPDLVWFEQEPTWQAVAEGRLQRGLSDFSLTVQTTDDYGIDSDFAAKIRCSGRSRGSHRSGGVMVMRLQQR